MAANNEAVRSRLQDRNNPPEAMNMEAAELLLRMDQERRNNSEPHNVEYQTMLRDVLRQVETAMLHRDSENSDPGAVSRSRYETSGKVTRTETCEVARPSRDIRASSTRNIVFVAIIIVLITLMGVVTFLGSTRTIPFPERQTESHIQLQQEISELRQRVQDLEQNVLKAFEKTAKAIERVSSDSKSDFNEDDHQSRSKKSTERPCPEDNTESGNEKGISNKAKHYLSYLWDWSIFAVFIVAVEWLAGRVTR